MKNWKDIRPLPPTIPTDDMEHLQNMIDAIRQYDDVEKMLMFGSYIYPDPIPKNSYRFLIIIATKGIDPEGRLPSQQELQQQYDTLQTPIQCLVISATDMSYCIEHSNRFYIDIITEGHLLYNRNRQKVSSVSFKDSLWQRYQDAENTYRIYQRKFHQWQTLYETNKKEMPELRPLFLHQQIEVCFVMLEMFFAGYLPPSHQSGHDLVCMSRTMELYDLRLREKILYRNRSIRYLNRQYAACRYWDNDIYPVSEDLIKEWEQIPQELFPLISSICQEYLDMLTAVQKKWLGE